MVITFAIHLPAVSSLIGILCVCVCVCVAHCYRSAPMRSTRTATSSTGASTITSPLLVVYLMLPPVCQPPTRMPEVRRTLPNQPHHQTPHQHQTLSTPASYHSAWPARARWRPLLHRRLSPEALRSPQRSAVMIVATTLMPPAVIPPRYRPCAHRSPFQAGGGP